MSSSSSTGSSKPLFRARVLEVKEDAGVIQPATLAQHSGWMFTGRSRGGGILVLCDGAEIWLVKEVALREKG